jgi:predicted transcriptional regulator YheO
VLALEVQVALVEPVAQVLLEEAEVVLHGLALEVDLATR